MALKQYITGLYIKNYRQFRHIRLDFCDPVTNEALDKICFIGSNGTGKSTLLELLSRVCLATLLRQNVDPSYPDSLVCWQIQVDKERYFILKSGSIDLLPNRHLVLPRHVEEISAWEALWDDEVPFNQAHPQFQRFVDIGLGLTNSFATKVTLHPNVSDLAIHSISDGIQTIDKVPQTTLNKALPLMGNVPAFHRSKASDLTDFWNFLIYQIKKRESDYHAFLDDEANQSLSVAEARQKFNAENPSILDGLAKQWDSILEQAGLELDVQNAKIPIQLNENLEAYIRLKDTDTTIDYNLLSAGVRNFIFQLGHIYTLYFNRQIDRGFLFLDEPEQSLYPDFLYDIIERYLSIIQNTQLFVATHSEIVAAQFKPAERIRLQFDDDGSVSWRRGIAPEGDDPNDVLRNDFSVRNLYGKEGIRQWHRYLDLRQRIVTTDDAEEKIRLMDEYLKIGNAYNFAPNEIPE